jgi:hypothetical protein
VRRHRDRSVASFSVFTCFSYLQIRVGKQTENIKRRDEQAATTECAKNQSKARARAFTVLHLHGGIHVILSGEKRFFSVAKDRDGGEILASAILPTARCSVALFYSRYKYEI